MPNRSGQENSREGQNNNWMCGSKGRNAEDPPHDLLQVHCTSEHNRSNQCYNCGGEDHQARTYSDVCSTAGKPANHRFGGRACDPPTSRNKSRGKEAMGTAEKAAWQGTKEDSAAGAREGTADKQTAEASGPEEAMDTTEGWP